MVGVGSRGTIAAVVPFPRIRYERSACIPMQVSEGVETGGRCQTPVFNCTSGSYQTRVSQLAGVDMMRRYRQYTFSGRSDLRSSDADLYSNFTYPFLLTPRSILTLGCHFRRSSGYVPHGASAELAHTDRHLGEYAAWKANLCNVSALS
jgi:hypothetical protein